MHFAPFCKTTHFPIGFDYFADFPDRVLMIFCNSGSTWGDIVVTLGSVLTYEGGSGVTLG